MIGALAPDLSGQRADRIALSRLDAIAGNWPRTAALHVPSSHTEQHVELRVLEGAANDEGGGDELHARRAELRGCRLGCWRPDGQSCYARVLAELASATIK